MKPISLSIKFVFLISLLSFSPPLNSEELETKTKLSIEDAFTFSDYFDILVDCVMCPFKNLGIDQSQKAECLFDDLQKRNFNFWGSIILLSSFLIAILWLIILLIALMVIQIRRTC